MIISEWRLHGCYYTNSRTSESLSKRDFEAILDREVTELARQIVVSVSGTAINYHTPGAPMVLKVKDQIKSFIGTQSDD